MRGKQSGQGTRSYGDGTNEGQGKANQRPDYRYGVGQHDNPALSIFRNFIQRLGHTTTHSLPIWYPSTLRLRAEFFYGPDGAAYELVAIVRSSFFCSGRCSRIRQSPDRARDARQ